MTIMVGYIPEFMKGVPILVPKPHCGDIFGNLIYVLCVYICTLSVAIFNPFLTFITNIPFNNISATVDQNNSYQTFLEGSPNTLVFGPLINHIIVSPLVKIDRDAFSLLVVSSFYAYMA